MNGVLSSILLIFIGLAGGLAVGGGFIAFLVVLDVIPRLARITRLQSDIKWLEFAVIAGTVFSTLTDFFSWKFRILPVGTVLIGLLAGMFIGMVAAALTEVLNVFPILARRLQLENFVFHLLMAMVLGKVAGSLFDWIVYHTL
jgi:stage V sporulation protein AB